MLLPPILEWDLGGKICALLRMVQSAPRHSPSCGSRCPGRRLQLMIPGVQSPGERSVLLEAERGSGVGMKRGCEERPRPRRAEGMLGPLPRLKKLRGRRPSRTRRPRCRTGRGRTRRLHHLRNKQRVSTWGSDAQTHIWLLSLCIILISV